MPARDAPAGPSRRSLLRAAAFPALATLSPAALGWDLAQAQAPGGVLQIGMTASAVPLSNGCPDQGGEGQRFMGITVYDQLVMWDLSRSDVPSVLRPGLATNWTVEEANPKRWTFTLRDGVVFHDGHVLDAQDIAFSFDRAFKRDAPWFDPRASAQVTPRFPTVVGWGTTDNRTFWVDTSIPDSTLPFSLTWLGIVHKGAWEAAGSNWDNYLLKAVGTGPWKLTTFSVRERAELARFEGYWDKARVPKCSRLILLPMPEGNTRVAALRSGQVTFVEAPPPDAVPSLKAAQFGIVTNAYPHNWTWHLSMVEGSPWRDLRVRKAANLALNRAELKELLGGLMIEGNGLMPPGHPWAGKPSFKLAYNPDEAKKLMAEAGFGPNKRIATKIAISSSGSGQMQPLPMNEYIQQSLRDIGIDISFEVFDWNTLITVWQGGAKGPNAKGCTGINFSYAAIDPYSAFIRLLKSDLHAPRGVNWGWYSDPVFDAMFAEVYNTFDATKQDALLAKIHEKIVDEALFLFAAHDLNPRALSPRVKGFIQAQSWFQDLTPVTVA
jgi:ABC-type transport system substrate-binding protein